MPGYHHVVPPGQYTCICSMDVSQVRAISLPSRSQGKLTAIFAVAVTILSLVALFCCIPYASGYGFRPVSLLDNATAFWFGSGDWAHGIAVIPLAALLVFIKRAELSTVPINGSWAGLFVLLVSALTYWFGAVADLQYIGYLSLQGFLAGFVLWILGPAFFRKIFLIWVFITFTWPFVFLDQYVGFPLRLLMSDASAHFLNLVGVPALKDGTAILSAPNPGAGLLTGHRFSVDVADPCSGLHSLFALTMVSGFYAILTLRRWWQVLLVTLVAVPLAIFGNLCRIVMLTAGALLFGNTFAIGSLENPSWFHEAAGIMVYVAALSGVLVVAGIVKGGVPFRPRTRRRPRPREKLISSGGDHLRLESFRASPSRPDQIEDEDEDDKHLGNPPTEQANRNGALLWRPIVGLLVVAGAGVLVVLSSTSHRAGVAGVKMDLPDSIDDALGFDGDLVREHRLLPADTEFVKKQYLSASPTLITCEIVLTGAERSSIHRAEACLLGQGWTLLSAEEVNVPVVTGRAQRVKLLQLSKVRDGQQLFGYFLYWYVGADRITDDTLSRIFLSTWDQLTRGVNHRWAYVTVNGELAPSQSGSEEAKRALVSRLIRFAADIIPIVQKPETLAKTANAHELTRRQTRTNPIAD
jgi:exosortase